MDGSNDELADLFKRRTAWFGNFKKWKWISWILLIGIAVGSAAAASQLFPPYTPWISLGVAAFSSVLAVLQPNERASAYRRARVELDLAVKRMHVPEDGYVDALARGEGIIGEDPRVRHPPSDVSTKVI